MKTVITHPTYGKIALEEGFFSGKKQLFINGAPLRRQNKTTFIYESENGPMPAIIKGSFATGTSLLLCGETIALSPRTRWYEYVLCAFIFVFIMIWGNSATLCAIFPVVGGALGGGISGAAMITSLALMKRTRSFFLKLLINTGIFLVTLLICGLLGLVFALALSAAM
ncbi:MAG: hypothetical protein IJF31_00995 [Clostridia bacterium]|nr:hypothetical protein [Clostridia bacterium]